MLMWDNNQREFQIDEEDIHLLEAGWYMVDKLMGYVIYEWYDVTLHKVFRESVHRLVMMYHYGKSSLQNMVVDHINGDTSDNRKSNLQICTQAQNIYKQRRRTSSKTGYRGVHFCQYKKPPQYLAQIASKPNYKYIGYFMTAEEAAHAYDKEAKERYGSFAYQNFPNI